MTRLNDRFAHLDPSADIEAGKRHHTDATVDRNAPDILAETVQVTPIDDGQFSAALDVVQSDAPGKARVAKFLLVGDAEAACHALKHYRLHIDLLRQVETLLEDLPVLPAMAGTLEVITGGVAAALLDDHDFMHRGGGHPHNHRSAWKPLAEAINTDFPDALDAFELHIDRALEMQFIEDQKLFGLLKEGLTSQCLVWIRGTMVFFDVV